MERSSDWLEQALWDLKHARVDLEHGFYDWSSFSGQQAAENAAKALLQSLGAEAWGHSVFDLLRALPQDRAASDELLDAALELDKAYIPIRYPDAHPSGSPSRRYTKREAERILTYAEAVVSFCQSHLS